MAIRIVKPTGNARRQLGYTDNSLLDTIKRIKSLSAGKKRVSGRNSAGQLVVSHRGGGAKRLYRFVDFSQTAKLGETAKIKAIEYDPNRSANIALLEYADGSMSYILASVGMKKNGSIVCDEKTLVKHGNRMKLKNIPGATQIYNIEVTNGKGGQLCRSAGNFATLLGFDGKYAQIRMPSGEVRKIVSEMYASIGIVSNTDHNNVSIGKAGRTRMMGRRPIVRGKVKNPCDHPHGGGEGRNSIGMKYPKTPWGAPALGPRTRNKKKASGRLIISRRKK